MAKKKTKSSTFSFGDNVVAAPGELDQPNDNNVYEGEEVVVVNNLPDTPGTSADKVPVDARKKSGLNNHESTTSPYACGPVAIDCGPGLATYWVPKHLLRSPKWSTTSAGGIISLPGVSTATGHTLVHYLYTSTYQALEAEGDDSAAPAHIKFKQALLTFNLASTYELQDLERLAKEQIEMYGSHMALVEVLENVRKEFSKMASSWFHEYLQARAEEQFHLDFTLFTGKAFLESVGKGTLQRFMTCHIVKMFSEKLTHTLQRPESRYLDEKKDDAVFDEIQDAAVKTHHCPWCHSGHQTDMCTASDGISFEFPDASCQNVDEVISLENSSVPDFAVPGSLIEESSCPDVSDMEKEQSIVKIDPTQVSKELYEPKVAVEAEKHDLPAAESGPEERKAKAEVLILEKVALNMECMLENASAVPGAAIVGIPRTFGGVSASKTPKKKEKAGPLAHEEEANPNTVAASGPVVQGLGCGFDCAHEETSYSEPAPEELDEPPLPETLVVTEGQVQTLHDGPVWDEAPPTRPEVYPIPEPVPEAVRDVPVVDPYAGLNKKQKKKLLAKMKREAMAEAYAKRVENEKAATASAKQEAEAGAEQLRSEEEEAEKMRIDEKATTDATKFERQKGDIWDVWGAITATTSKNRKKINKGIVEKEAMPVPEEPEPEPTAEPEPVTRQEALPGLEQEYKPEPGLIPAETMPENSSTLCPRRSHHLLEGDSWKTCERCRAMLREIAVQLAKENKTVLL